MSVNLVESVAHRILNRCELARSKSPDGVDTETILNPHNDSSLDDYSLDDYFHSDCSLNDCPPDDYSLDDSPADDYSRNGCSLDDCTYCMYCTCRKSIRSCV
ncbi:hypothetical protein NW759_015871 [Fusarium solani]|nr:hypothetical protein NW759_015871 [Fusarium solani]